MSDEIRKKVRGILKEEFSTSQKDRLTKLINALEFKDDVNSAGGEIFAVGGIVRDAIMGTPSDDLDIVVRGVPYDQLFAILSKYGTPTDTSKNKEDKDFGSTKFVSKNKSFNKFLASNGVDATIDVMLPRKDAKDPNVKGHKGITSDVNPNYTIYDDLDRRDITINAIAIDSNGNLIANGTGLEDIKKGVIKAVSEDAFIEDPLRMLRAIRFAARYNYAIDPGTEKLIKDHAALLADKAELPKERFLMEFKKMIGKADLGRAVKMLVEFGMYEHMFGIKPKFTKYDKFDKAHNVGEMAYMMFDGEPANTIIPLIENNITNDAYNLGYARALVNYGLNKDKNMDIVARAQFLAKLYKVSRDAMVESSYINEGDRDIVMKFESGALPKDDHDLQFKGGEFKDFVVQKIIEKNGGFVGKRDGPKMGKAKLLVLQAIYGEKIKNEKEEIKRFLDSSSDQWMS